MSLGLQGNFSSTKSNSSSNCEKISESEMKCGIPDLSPGIYSFFFYCLNISSVVSSSVQLNVYANPRFLNASPEYVAAGTPVLIPFGGEIQENLSYAVLVNDTEYLQTVVNSSSKSLNFTMARA